MHPHNGALAQDFGENLVATRIINADDVIYKVLFVLQFLGSYCPGGLFGGRVHSYHGNNWTIHELCYFCDQVKR